ncbi:N(4)-(Beta-N-acetylglucosaminyl)-L-asparaginase- like [Aphelenchoides fujianensis]|nr:N(4)-(Beta-N-acetylglucosaminyl)-L-asparaginase- like [Aphelenchoides fujianensis]
MRSIYFCLLLLLAPLRVEAGGGRELPLVIGTWGNADFQAVAQKAWDEVNAGGSRMSALVDGLSECENRQCDRTVGFGGDPDETGETTLDALVMDGPQQLMGAVADLRRVKEAARVAWAVMNFTEHSMLAGESATKFATSMGFLETTLATNESLKRHKDWQAANCQPNFWKNVSPNPKASCGPYKPHSSAFFSSNPRGISAELDRFNEKSHDTLGLVVIDKNGDVSAGTSTNGAANKISGRVGDSPIPGAGAFVDNEVGGAAGTGDGDVMMRFLPSFLTVEAMRAGNSPRKAAQIAIRRIRKHYPNFMGAIVAANRNGEYGAACNGLSRFPFSIPSKYGTTVESVPCEQ